MTRRSLFHCALAASVIAMIVIWGGRDTPDPLENTTPAAATPQAATSTQTMTRTSTTPSPNSPPQGSDEAPEALPVDPTDQITLNNATDAATLSAYQSVAESFMKAFARPPATLTEPQWWNDVAALLDEQARVAYQGTDPANVPFTTITGPATIVPSGEAPMTLLAVARVPTDAGWYLVELTTTGDGIRVTRATPDTPQP